MTNGPHFNNWSASSPVTKFTKPKPRCRFVSRSIIKTASSMLTWVPNCAQNARKPRHDVKKTLFNPPKCVPCDRVQLCTGRRRETCWHRNKVTLRPTNFVVLHHQAFRGKTTCYSGMQAFRIRIGVQSACHLRMNRASQMQ